MQEYSQELLTCFTRTMTYTLRRIRSLSVGY